MAAMPQRLRALALLFLIAVELAGCGGVQPCEGTPRQSLGPCSIGRPKDSS